MADRRNFLNDVNSAGSVIAANGVYTESYKVAYGQKGSEAASIDYNVADKRFNIMVGGKLGGANALNLKLGEHKGVSLEVQGDSADTEDLVIRTANGQGTLVIDYSSKTVRPDLALTNQC